MTTYNTLVSAVKAVSEDDSGEFASFIPFAIDLAQETLAKDLDFFRLKETKVITVNTSGAVNAVTSIEDSKFLYPSNAYTSATNLELVDISFIKEYNANISASAASTPKYYAFGATSETIHFAPPANISVDITLEYFEMPEKISSGNQTNKLTEKAPGALYCATMIEMNLFTEDYNKLQIWRDRYNEHLLRNFSISKRERKEIGDDPRYQTTRNE